MIDKGEGQMLAGHNWLNVFSPYVNKEANKRSGNVFSFFKIIFCVLHLLPFSLPVETF